MKLLKSEKGIPIPKLYLVTNREEIGDIPKGIPYIYADEELEDTLVRMLEYEVLYQRAVATGYPFNFKRILRENGFEDIEDHSFGGTSWNIRANLKTDGKIKYESIDDMPHLEGSVSEFKRFVKDSSVYVDVTVLKGLKIFPEWMGDFEEAINTNITTFATWDTNMYNKKLEGMYGGVRLTPPHKNLIIIDISGSIPRAVSSTTLALAKNMAENFYADLMITGSKTTLYDFNEVRELDVRKVYYQNGTDNDQVYFKKLVTEIQRDYDTVVVFGDDDSPGCDWVNKYNKGTKTISKEDGQEICKWNVNHVISFHTWATDRVAAYADWFTPEKTTYMEDWVKDMRGY